MIYRKTIQKHPHTNVLKLENWISNQHMFINPHNMFKCIILNDADEKNKLTNKPRCKKVSYTVNMLIC